MPWRWGRAHLCSPAFTLGPGGGCSELALAYLWLNLPSPVVPTAWFQVSAHTASVLEGVVRPGTHAPGGGGLSTPQGHRPPSLCSPAIVCCQELYSWCPAFHSKRRGPKVKREAWATGPLGMLDPWLCCSPVERAHRKGLHSRGPGPTTSSRLSEDWCSCPLCGFSMEKVESLPGASGFPALRCFFLVMRFGRFSGHHVHACICSGRHVCAWLPTAPPARMGVGRGCSWAPPEVRRCVPMTTKPCAGGRVSG